MMEAALLGVPYEGRIPDYSNRTAGGMAGGAYGGMSGEPADVAPEVLEHRELRWDQDRAYEESLAADRCVRTCTVRCAYPCFWSAFCWQRDTAGACSVACLVCACYNNGCNGYIPVLGHANLSSKTRSRPTTPWL